jgi:REP element-mobilizing transposase RayT
MLHADLRERLWPYFAAVASNHEMACLAVGGVDDHLHSILRIPPKMAVSKGLQTIKSVTSKWIHETFPPLHDFAWQEGFGAFTISVSGVDETRRYIANQAEHHRTVTFEQEYRAFLERHGIEIDERYWLD